MLETTESDGRMVTDWLLPLSATDIEPLTLLPRTERLIDEALALPETLPDALLVNSCQLPLIDEPLAFRLLLTSNL